MSTSRKPPSPTAVEPEWEPAPKSKGARAAPPPVTGDIPLDKTVVGGDAGLASLALRTSEASAFLVVCMGPNVGHRYPLFDKTLMGRSSSADITLADDRVSGKHAEVHKNGNGFVIRDLGSANGTLVNAKKISEQPLVEGDLVQVGYTVFKFQAHNGRVDRISDPQILSPGMSGVPMPIPMGGMPMGGMPMGGMPMGMPMGGMPMGGMPMGMPMQVPPPTNPMVPQAEQEMNVEEIVGNVKKIIGLFTPHLKKIALCTMVGLLGGVALAAVSKPGAKAKFEMNIITPQQDKGAATGVSADRAGAARSNFKSPLLIRRTLAALGEPTSDDRIAVIGALLSFESTTPNYGTPPPVQNFVGEFQASSPESALLFLDTHVRQFIESEVEKTTKVIATRIDYLGGEIQKAEITLKQTDEALKQFKQEFIGSLPENVASMQTQIFDLEKQKGDHTSAIEQLKLEIASAQVSGGGQTRKQREIKAVQEQIAELKASGLGDNHPDVVAIKKRLARIEEAPEVTGGSGKSGDKSLAQLKAELAARMLSLETVTGRLDDLKSKQEKMPEFTAKYTDLTRSYDSSKKLYETLFQEKSTAEYQLGFEKTSAEGRFEIVQSPTAEKQAAGKFYGKKVGMGLGGGLALGIGIALFINLLGIWRKT